MAGTVALLALFAFLCSIVVVGIVAYNATQARPTLEDLHPENSKKYTKPALIFMLVAFASGWIFVIAGIVWLVETIIAAIP
ncbi:membrane protein [Microbacterium phage OscarSo]|uniref:Membrane protein n=1 Tax=Microbacterium phage OscarSo TaxID=2985324 RepID=A0A9X9P5N4_9CAUD|nr:membrane protein [Microbacterium phage OscarSo]UYL87161.1 membrane protein [Microbacterium phage OscarSo]